MKNIVVLISGQGRNLQALIEAQQAGHLNGRIAAVVSNKADAGGLVRAREAGILTEVVPHIDYADRSVFDTALAAVIERHHPDIVVMAGFMRVVGDDFTRRFRGRMLNIHPSLLPKYPGLKTHQRALEAGDTEHGATVHFVTEELDGGAAVIQGRLSVEAQDTAQTLGERVMRDIEVKIYPQAVNWVAKGELKLQNEQVWFRGQRRTTPLSLDDLDVEFR